MGWPDLTRDNPENRVAGNADDLVKHTTYLALIESLLAREPWASGMGVHECHAGPGIYAVEDERRAGIAAVAETPLGALQRRALERAGVDTEAHYAGSALLVTGALDEHDGSHTYEAYEWDPRTRASLRAVVGRDRVLGSTDRARFDGETFIADRLPSWDRRHLVLMDPFAVWDRDKHEERRDRYRRIFDALRSHASPPAWLLYLTWRKRRALPRFLVKPQVEVSWCFGVPCAIHVGCAAELAAPLASRVRDRVGRVARELAKKGVVEHGEGGGDELVRVHVR